MHETHLVGTIAEFAVGVDLLKAGWNVFTPWGTFLRYDLVIERDGSFFRVQVKNGTYKCGVVSFRNSSIYTYKSNHVVKSYDKSQIDFYGIYCAELEKCYLVPVENTNTRETSLRIKPTLNNQASKIRWAKDYDLTVA